MVRIGPLSRGEEARCPRCETVLRRHAAPSLEVPLALCIAGLVLYAVTMTMPFIGMQLLGQVRSSHVETGAFAFLQDGYAVLTVLVLLTLVAVPLMRLLLLLTVLVGLGCGRRPAGSTCPSAGMSGSGSGRCWRSSSSACSSPTRGSRTWRRSRSGRRPMAWRRWPSPRWR
jgi:hypothetical protein